jgi:chromosome segregation ATPase
LQAEINGHTKSIGDNNAQINDLQAQIQKLEGEKQDALKQFNDLQTQAAADRQAMQQQIDEKEANLRAITGERDALKTQVDTLQADLAARGDPQQHAEAIANLTQQHQQQLDAKDQALATREAELTQQITIREQQIQQLNTLLQQKQVEIDGHVADIGNNQQQARDQINQLNLRIAALEGENERLKDRIVAATLAINEAADNLDTLMNSEPNAANQTEINDTFNEIEASLQAISNSLQGRGSSSLSSSSSSSSSSAAAAPPKTMLDLNTVISFKGHDTKLGILIWYLEQKNKQVKTPGNKYAIALGLIRTATTVEEVDAILQKNNIEWTSDGSRFKGGLRTRKGKKMRKTKKIYIK